MNLAQKYGGEKIPAKPYEGQIKLETKQPTITLKKKPKSK